MALLWQCQPKLTVRMQSSECSSLSRTLLNGGLTDPNDANAYWQEAAPTAAQLDPNLQPQFNENNVRIPIPGPRRYMSSVELQRQFLALRRAGALPLQARLERRSLTSCALLTHRELSFVFSLGASLPPFLPN